MDQIDDLVSTIIGWQPSSKKAIRVSLPRPLYRGRGPDLEAVIGQLNNGLLFASVQTIDGSDVLDTASYDTDKVPVLPNGYKLINLTTSLVDGIHVASATFQYRVGKTPAGDDVGVIEYTVRYFPRNAELSKLVSLYASQELEGGKINVNLSATTHDPRDISLKMEIVCSDKLYSELHFDSQGNLLKTSRTLFISNRHPLYQLYNDITANYRVDPLKTAVSLVRGFPIQRPLHIEQLIVVQPSVYQPKLL